MSTKKKGIGSRPASGAQDEEIDEFIQDFRQVALLVSPVHDSSFSGWVKFRLGAQLNSKKLGRICVIEEATRTCKRNEM